MELIDTHSHLDFAAFDPDREAVLERCRQAGINRIIVPGVLHSSWNTTLSVCERHAGLYPALGLHPVFLQEHRESDTDALPAALESSDAIAVGEIGLDFYIKTLDRQQQLALFERQVEIAVNANLPVILHVRKAHEEVLSILNKYRPRGGIAHAFNGSEQQAQRYVDLGFCLGFGGTLTWPGSRHIHQLARTLPVSSIVLETDAPDMVVAAHKGERNSPEYLTDCLNALAELRETDPVEIATQTTANAEAVLGITS